jgi:ADP-glucose pyrophosphorylase
MHSGIDNVGILSQYRPHGLVRHIGTGEHWDFMGRKRGIRMLTPYIGLKGSDWYQGTADAVYQNTDYIKEFRPEHILVAAADHIYRMDYKPLINFHLRNKADATICFTKMKTRSHRFGYGIINKKKQLVRYLEKPSSPPMNSVATLSQRSLITADHSPMFSKATGHMRAPSSHTMKQIWIYSSVKSTCTNGRYAPTYLNAVGTGIGHLRT